MKNGRKESRRSLLTRRSLVLAMIHQRPDAFLPVERAAVHLI